MPSNVAPTGLARELAARAASGRPIRIGLVGSGEMGTDIVTRTAMMDGIEVAAIAEIDLPAAHCAVEIAFGEPGHSREIARPDAFDAAIEAGRIAVTDNVDAMLESGLIDVVIDATGVPAVGAEIGLGAMERGKHLVMMNVEADVTIGAYLRREAERLGVVYSLGAGDEPSSCMELIEFVAAMGHRIVCAGKGKNNPLNIDATPDAYEEEARQRNMNPRLLVEFVDGSKTMVEMAAIANATGLIPDVDGMHGPAAGPEALSRVLVPKRDGGVLSDIGRVDFSVGRGLAPGVFVIAHAEHPRILERMRDLKMGEGPYFAFIRPYHLTSLEVPLTCARAVLYGKPDMVPLARPVAEVCAVAKRDLAPGESLDQIGEYSYRAWIMEAGRARAAQAHPAGLLTGASVHAPIAKGELITAANATLPDAPIVDLRRRQDRLLAEEELADA
ncbi:MAG: homoserine dehydrogenase [Alphaproteobacteria bacterium]|nr:MAG: homoserine dehydrogenase [Alphaproteobacteria bacterium]